MKNLRIWQTLSLFILLLSITLPLSAKSDLLTKLNTITLIIRTQSLETSLFAEKYLLRFKQPLDHSHPEKGSFSQRVIVAHVGYDRPTLMVTEGYGAARSLNPGYYEELSKPVSYTHLTLPTSDLFVRLFVPFIRENGLLPESVKEDRQRCFIVLTFRMI